MLTQLINRLDKIEKLLLGQRANNVEFLRIDEACDFIKTPKNTVYKLVEDRDIPHIKRGKILLFRKDKLVEWLDAKKVLTVKELEKIPSGSNKIRKGSIRWIFIHLIPF